MKKLSRKLRAAADAAASYEPSSFQKHAQFLRDLSGLCRKGLLRLAWNSSEKRVEQQTLDNLKAHPDVERFLQLARESTPDQLEDLSRRSLQEIDGMAATFEAGVLCGWLRGPFWSKGLKGRSPGVRKLWSRKRLWPKVPDLAQSRGLVLLHGPHLGNKKALPMPSNWERPWTPIASELTKMDGDKLWLKRRVMGVVAFCHEATPYAQDWSGPTSECECVCPQLDFDNCQKGKISS